MIEPSRIAILDDRPPREDADYVLYWMQQAMRAEGNLALDHAVACANDLGLPVVVSFSLTGVESPPYPDANARHYAFLLQGIADVAATLAKKNIGFVLRFGKPDEMNVEHAKRAALVVCDRGYLKPQKEWQARFVKRAACRIERVETDAVVPLDVVSNKHEFAARTIRPKIEKNWDAFLVSHRSPTPRHKADKLRLRSDADPAEPETILRKLKVDTDVGPVRRFAGGQTEARRRLKRFLGSHFDGYLDGRNEPDALAVSQLSPYLHFGQISPLEVALAAKKAKGSKEDRRSFLDELIVRRELAQNHVEHEPNYDSLDGVPPWARKTLDEHRKDERQHIYSRAQLEDGKTHDEYWNASMREMRETGYMHNRMRMYWGKKIVEWSKTPETAFDHALAINNRYFLDGRDANSFTNVGWLFGLHDRPWFRRPVFGTVRYLGEATLKKFDGKAWLKSVDTLIEAEKE